MDPIFNAVKPSLGIYHDTKKPSALNELLALQQANFIDIDRSDQAIQLKDRAYKEITLWERFVDFFAACFGYETTQQKIDSVFNKIIKEDEKKKSSSRETEKEETLAKGEQKESEQKEAEQQEKAAKEEAKKAQEQEKAEKAQEQERIAKEKAEQQKHAQEQAEQEERIKKEAEIERLKKDLEDKERELIKSRELNERNAMHAEDGKSQVVFKKEDIAKQLEIERLKKEAEQKKLKENLEYANELFKSLDQTCLSDIGYDDEKVNIAHKEIEAKLEGLDQDKRQACYIHLASLPHYKLAKQYADIARVTIQNPDDSITNARFKIDYNIGEAAGYIKTIKYIDVRKQLRDEYDDEMKVLKMRKKRFDLENEAFAGREYQKLNAEFNATVTANYLLEKERDEDLNFYLNQIESRLLDRVYSSLAMNCTSLVKARKFADALGKERKSTYDFNGLYTYDESLEYMKKLNGTDEFFDKLNRYEFDAAYDCGAGISIGNKVDGTLFSEFDKKSIIIINHHAARYYIENKKWDLAKRYIDSLKFKDVQKPYLEQLKIKLNEEIEKVKSKLSRCIDTNALIAIGNNEDKIKAAIDAIDNELQNLNPDGKQECYKFLAGINHYRIAKKYAELAKLPFEDITNKVKSIRELITALKYDEAEKLINLIRFYDVKMRLNSEIDYKKYCESTKS